MANTSAVRKTRHRSENVVQDFSILYTLANVHIGVPRRRVVFDIYNFV